MLLLAYRHVDDREGELDKLFSIDRQRQDLENAIGYARWLYTVGANRIALPGTSISGGYIILAVGKDGDIAAVLPIRKSR